MELPTFAVSSREFPVPTNIDPIFMFWVSRFEVLSVALAMSRLPTGVPIGISIIGGGFFKLGKPGGFRMFDTREVLWTSIGMGLGVFKG